MIRAAEVNHCCHSAPLSNRQISSRPQPAQFLLVLLVTGRSCFVDCAFMDSDQLALNLRLGHGDRSLRS
jgi:hypothetical protein